MSSDLLNGIFFKKISSSVSISLNSKRYQKTNYLFLMYLLEKSELEFTILNFDPLFFRFYLSHKKPNTKYNITSGFSFFSSTTLIKDIFSSINKNNNNLLIIGLNFLEQEKIKEFFYYLDNAKSMNNFSKIIFASLNSNDLVNNLINNNCLFSLNEISHAVNKNNLYLKYDFYNHKKLNKENIVFSYEINEQRGLINFFNEILLHNLELQKIFNEVEKPIEHKTQMNLNLTEEEKKNKNELILPFIKTEEEKKKAFEIAEPEENEEEVEIGEDPDDDLDI